MAEERGGVQAVERALDVLEVLGEAESSQGVSELAQATGLPHATIHRMLVTLTGRGYARQERQSRKYQLGSGLLRLGAHAGRLLGSRARPYLAELAEVSGETANLAVLEEEHVVYLAQVQSRHKVRMFTDVGNRLLPHTTAVGKVLLAARPVAELDRILDRNGLPAHTPNTITDAVRFRLELKTVSAQGYAVDDEEEELGVRCLAVPVHGQTGTEAALSVSGPAGRLQQAHRDDLVPQMRRIAAAVSADLFGVAAGGA